MDTYQRILYILQIIGAGCAALGAIWGIFVGVCALIKKYYSKAAKTLQEVQTLNDTVSTLAETVQKLVLELKPNGGSSLRDAINRNEKDVKQVKFVNQTHFDYLIQVPMFSTDGNGQYVWVNRACCEFYDKHPADLMGTAWEVYIEQTERITVREEWIRAVAEERAFDMIYHITSENGSLRRVRCRAYGSKATGYMGFLYPAEEPKSSF